MKKCKMTSFWLVFAIPFFIIGIIFLFVGMKIFVAQTDFKNNAKESNAVITNIETYTDSEGYTEYNVMVRYEVDGKIYDEELNSYSSDMYVGKTLTIYYNQNNPTEISYTDMEFAFLVFPILGLIFTLIGGGIFVKLIIDNKKRKRLLNSKFIIQAKIIDFVINGSISVNGKHPYMLVASTISPYDGNTYVFNSDSVWNDLNPIIKQYNITTVPVYVNPQNYKEYYLDIDIFNQYLDNNIC